MTVASNTYVAIAPVTKKPIEVTKSARTRPRPQKQFKITLNDERYCEIALARKHTMKTTLEDERY
jgi:hypothetical protein